MLTIEKLKERKEKLTKEWNDLKNKGDQMNDTLQQMKVRMNEIAGAIVENIDMEKEITGVEVPPPGLESAPTPSVPSVHPGEPLGDLVPSDSKVADDSEFPVDTAFTKSKKDKK